MIQVLISGSQPLYRMAVANQLEHLDDLHWQVSGHPLAIPAMDLKRSDLLIICADTNDIELMAQLDHCPRLTPGKVVLFAGCQGNRHLKLVLDAKIDLCLPLSIPLHQTRNYLTRLLRGSTSQVRQQALSDPDIKRGFHPDLTDLTLGERKVLFNLQQGLSNQAIAERMNICLNTVKVHLARSCRKAGFKNRYHAASMTRSRLAAGQALF
ncbi:MAG: LuxR C-terminal-related transcriptional regulator [Motiliproteus sp.]